MRRVTKAEVNPIFTNDEEQLEYCLECWKLYLRGGDDRDLGTKTMTGMVGNSDGYGSDMYDEQHKTDMQFGQATYVVISALSQLHRWAIYKSCSVASPWNYPNANLVTVAELARIELISKLKKNVCTARRF